MSELDLPTRIKGHCPNCGSDRLADVVGHHRQAHDAKGGGPDWGAAWTDYRILQCRGCEVAYFQQEKLWEEWDDWHEVTYWPSPSKRKKPDWSSSLWRSGDAALISLFDEIYRALNDDLRVLSAIGIRTAFDRATELVGIDPAKTFAEKLVKLVELGLIGGDEKVILNILTDAGSAAAHRGWKPEPQELNTMMDVFEAFLHRTFILRPEAKSLQKKIPAKPQRRKP